jgi:hypothetical protein
MILDQRQVKSDIKDLLPQQWMAISTIKRGMRVDESNRHRRQAVTEGEPICAFVRWTDVIIWKKKLLMSIDKISRPNFQPQ